MNKWKLFSERMTARYSSEAELEGRFEDCLIFILGWEPRAEITRQIPIQFGHENKRADIILKANDKNAVVIELKKQGLQIRDHELGQLFSYMRQTYTRFGLLVGDRISLYCIIRPTSNTKSGKLRTANPANIERRIRKTSNTFYALPDLVFG